MPGTSIKDYRNQILSEITHYDMPKNAKENFAHIDKDYPTQSGRISSASSYSSNYGRSPRLCSAMSARSNTQRLNSAMSSNNGRTPRPNSVGGGMSIYERRVLRRKRPLVADCLGFTPEDQKVYRQKKLLNDKMLAEICIEKTEYGMVWKWVDLLITKPNCDFIAILEILEDRGFGWLCDEMRVEVMVEKEDLEIEEYVYREAGVLIHREYGRSKRISETDKKDLQLMMALRYQAGVEVGRNQINTLQREIQSTSLKQREENGKMKVLIEKIQIFLRVQKSRLNDMMHDDFSPPDLLRDDPDPENKRTDYAEVLESSVDHLLEVIGRVLLERENLTDERKRCMGVLKMEKPVVQLDTILNYALQNAADDVVKSKREAEMSDQLAGSLDSRIKATRLECDRELANRDRHLIYIQSITNQKEDRIKQLERLLNESKRTVDDQKDEIEKWKRRAEMLEKTRRLGYYYPGWYDSLYDMDGIEYNRDDEHISTTQDRNTSYRPRTARETMFRSSSVPSVAASSKGPTIVRRSVPGTARVDSGRAAGYSQRKDSRTRKSVLKYSSSENC